MVGLGRLWLNSDLPIGWFGGGSSSTNSSTAVLFVVNMKGNPVKGILHRHCQNIASANLDHFKLLEWMLLGPFM